MSALIHWQFATARAHELRQAELSGPARPAASRFRRSRAITSAAPRRRPPRAN